MQTLSAADFPVFNGNENEDEYFEVKQEELKNLISKVVFCAATDDIRHILKVCLLDS